MYEFFQGEVVRRDEASVVLAVGGIAYRFSCSASTLRRLPAEGTARVYAHLVVREDRHDLYGFSDEAERHLFRQLLLVSGVGPAVAVQLLSAYEAAALASHIAGGATALLTRAKGIGKRTAERIIVELRDRIQKEGGVPAPSAAAPRADAVLALCSLGLPRAEAEKRVAAAESPGLDLEEIVRRALRPSR